MQPSPPGKHQSHLRLAVLSAGWLALLCVCFFKFPISNPPGTRWDLWVYVPDLWDPPRRDVTSGHSGWGYFPQRFDLLAVAAVIWAGAWGAGHLVLRIIRPQLPARCAERTVLALGVGLAALSLLTLGAGLAGALLRPFLGGAIVVAVILAVALRVIGGKFGIRNAECGIGASSVVTGEGDAKRASHGESSFVSGAHPAKSHVVLTLVASAPFVLAMLLGALLPSTDFDVNEYHFEGPKEYFQAGRISFLEHNVYTSFPFGTEMLTLLAMVLRDDWYRGALAGKCVLMGFGPLTALALYAAGRRWFGPIAGLSAAFLYLATPWIYRISTIAYAEGGVSFYLFATLLAVMLAIDCRRDDSSSQFRTLLLAGLMAGGAMSCKYPALVSVVIPLGVAAGVFAWQARGQSPRSWQLVLAYSGGVALVIGPWLIKNLIETGNPVYPLAYNIFGGRDWDAVLNARWRSGHSPATYAPSSLFGLACDVTYRSDWISPLLFGLAPAGLFASASRRRAGWLAAYVGWLFFSCWLFTHRIDRFWVPLLPVVALLAGAGVAWWTVLHGRAARIGLTLFVVAMAAYHLEFMTGMDFKTGFGAWCGYNDYLRDLDEASQVAANVTAPEIVYLNDHLPADAKVLAVGDAEMFVARFPVVYNTVFDRSIMEYWMGAKPGELGKDQPLRATGEIREKLKAEGITHVYVNWLEILRYRSPGNYGYTPFVTPERFAELQELGILEPAWSIPEATMDLERLDPLWVADLEKWGELLITHGLKGASIATFQVFPVSDGPARPVSGN